MGRRFGPAISLGVTLRTVTIWFWVVLVIIIREGVG